MLTETQKVAIRSHLGVPFAGTAQAGRLYGWRFTWYNEDLEYRMNNMAPGEEQMLTGSTLGSYQIQGSPRVGDVLTYDVTLNGAQLVPVSYEVQESDFALPPNPVNPSQSAPLYSIALNSATAINEALVASGVTAVGVMPADLFSPAYLTPYFAEVIVVSAPGSSLALAGSGQNNSNLLVANPGSGSPIAATMPDPVTRQQTPYYGYIALCNALRMSMANADLSLTYETADVVTFRKDEVRARRQKWLEYVYQLESVLGGRDYVDKFGGGRGSRGGACA